MSYTRKRALCWLYAVLMTAGMMLWLLLGPGIYFDVPDDPIILKAFLGFESGSPTNWHIFIHGLLAWPLYWLSTAFPNLPWFSYVQFALVIMAALVFAKSLMQVFVRHNQPLWMGAVLAIACLLALFYEFSAKMSYTYTATFLSMAAVMQIFSIEHRNGEKHVILGMLGALVLAALAYALRQDVLWPTLAFCGIAFLIQFVEYYLLRSVQLPPPQKKAMGISLLLVLIVVVAMIGVRAWELDRANVREYVTWQNSRVKIIDYYTWDSIPYEEYFRVGWNLETLDLAKAWCFLDPEISTEAMNHLTEYAESSGLPPLIQILRKAWAHFCKVVRYNPMEMRCLSLFAICAFTVLIGVCITRRWHYVGYGAVVLTAMGVMLIYLAYRGRLPIRALRTVVLPAGAIVLGLLPSCMPPKKQGLLLTCCALCTAMALWCFSDILPQVQEVNTFKRDKSASMIQLEQYAIAHPETLFLYDGSVMELDSRVFPEYPNGVPTNLTSWGGWGMRSPQNVKMFKRFGIDLHLFNAHDLLREEICIVSTSEKGEGPCLLQAWMEAELGCDVEIKQRHQIGNLAAYGFEIIPAP